MAIDYTIAAHPTMYRDVRFRSRLEATWAAFFDELRWSWEYEPLDLKGWVPDFLVHGAGRDLLVEVKPVVGSDEDTVEKISKAGGCKEFNLALCGISPIVQMKHLAYINTSCFCGSSKCGWQKRNFSKIGDSYDVIFGHWLPGSREPGYYGFQTGTRVDGAEMPPTMDEYVGVEISQLWAKAKNTTQWKGPTR